MKNLIRNIINLILIAVLIYSGYNIYLKLTEYKEADMVYEELRDLNKAEEINSRKEDLSNINEDFRFWLEVENTNIDYPVVQGKDNNYYLKKDFKNNTNGSGSIFMDYRNDYSIDKNTILYGHNMRNKTMFSRIEKYKEKEFFKENNKINVYTNYGIDVYEVFSVYATEPGFDYLDTSFSDDNTFLKYAQTVSDKSIYKYNGEVLASDKIITLSTCSYEFKDARTVVHGKLIETLEYSN